MAQIAPLAIGGVSSAISGIQGKHAREAQEKLARQMMAQQQPLIDAQRGLLDLSGQFARQFVPQAGNAINAVYNQSMGQFQPLMQDYQAMLKEATTSQGKFNAEGEGFMDTGRNLFNAGSAGWMGALSGLGDLQAAYRPFLTEGASAIEKFLPKGQALNRILAGQFGDINQGYKSASENIEAFAPRGGGRISTLANNDVKRNQDLNRARSEGTLNYGNLALQNFFQGAEGTRNVLGQKAGIAGQQTQAGLGMIGAGQQSKQQGIAEFGSKAGVGLQQLQAALQALGIAGGAAGNLGSLGSGFLNLGAQGGGNLYEMMNRQMDRAFGSQPSQGSGAEGLGSQLVKMFSSPGAQDWMKGLTKKGGSKSPVGIGPTSGPLGEYA